MKLWKLAVLWTVVLAGFVSVSHADPLVWSTPYGTIGLPLTATEVLFGYDGILKQAIGGASVPIYTDPKQIIAISVGAVAPWPNMSGVAIEPYVGIGHDVLREIPTLNQYKSFHLNVFGRYAASQGGRFGAGAAASYAPGQTTIVDAVPPVAPPAPSPTSRLNLFQSITGV